MVKLHLHVVVLTFCGGDDAAVVAVVDHLIASAYVVDSLSEGEKDGQKKKKKNESLEQPF